MKRTPILYHVVLSVLVINMSSACTQKNDSSQTVSDIKETTGDTKFTAPMIEPNVGQLSIPNGDARAPLAVETMKVDVMVVGRMARTQVTQVFRNHTGRQTEGTYSFTLPDGASLSRLAMTVGETLVEGELVEREKARMIYESIVRKQKDPALLEWQGGNRFSTQVFPIEPNKTKTVVIAYEVLLPEQDGKLKYIYNLPKLDGLAKGSDLGDFSFALNTEDGLGLKTKGYSAEVKQLAPGGEVRYKAKGFKPGGPIEVSFALNRTRGIKQSYAVKENKRYFIADVVPQLPSANNNTHQNIVIALDTSAGLGQPVLDRASAIANGLIDQAPEGAKIQVVTGDYKVRVCGVAPIEKSSARKCLSNLDAGGATDLQQLLLVAASEAKKLGDNTNVVLFSDGVASIGEMDAELIESNARKTMGDGVVLHTIAIGHSANETGLRKLARANNGQSIRLTPTEHIPTAITHITNTISEPLLVGVTATVKRGKLVNITPNAPQNLARGEAVAVMGRFDEARDAMIELTGTYRGQPWTQRIELQNSGGTNNMLLPRFWARRQLDVLQKQDAPRADIVQLSKTMGVLSPYTSFLVLESDAAFKKYQIKRKQEEATRRAKNQLKQDTIKNQDRKAPKEQTQVKNLEKKKGALQDLISRLKEDNPAAPGRFGSKGEQGSLPQVDGEMVDELDVKNIGTNRALSGKLLGGGALKNLFKNSTGFDTKMNVGMSDGLKIGKKEFKTTKGRRKKDTRAKRIKALERQKKKLKRAERVELLELYASTGKTEKAQAWFKVLQARIPKNQMPQGQIELLRVASTQKLFIDAFANALAARLKKPGTPMRTIKQFVRRCAIAKKDAMLIRTLSTNTLSAKDANMVLSTLKGYRRKKPIAPLFNTWKSNYTMREQLTIVNQYPQLLAEHRYDLLKAIALSKDATRSDILHFTNRALELSKGAETTKTTLEACVRGTLDTLSCRILVKRYAVAGVNNVDVSTLRSKLKGILERELKQTLRARVEDMANRSLILKAVALYEQQGNKDAAERLLSEMVEFAPHDYTQRMAFGHSLVNQDRVVQGCAQYATAVQLNPAKRDTFRTMMNLRRKHAKYTKAIRDCVVNGVSKLPVKRAISIILTWDTPDNDVDLHIHEPGHEHVSYQHQASKNGGLLYYDITDGYGPEIYVLGSGPVGTYPISLVYYNGTQRNVKATVTILRDAGSPEESRKDIKVVLPVPNKSKSFDIGKFILTARDKSGDTSVVKAP